MTRAEVYASVRVWLADPLERDGPRIASVMSATEPD
jgi:hypothetical protein